MSEQSPEPDDPPYVSVTVLSEHRSLPEVIETLGVLDRAWILALRIAAVDSTLRVMEAQASASSNSEQRYDQRAGKRLVLPQLGIEPEEIASLRRSLEDARGGPRPQVTLTMQSPLTVELSGWIASGSIGVIAAWQAFKYLVSNAEDIAGLPHRLRSGWSLARARADDASSVAQAARLRRELMELELAEAQQVDDLGRALRRLGPLVIDSNVGDDPTLS